MFCLIFTLKSLDQTCPEAQTIKYCCFLLCSALDNKTRRDVWNNCAKYLNTIKMSDIAHIEIYYKTIINSTKCQISKSRVTDLQVVAIAAALQGMK